MSNIEYIVILGYFVLLILVGAIFKGFSKDTSDFLRGGCKGTWWLVGSSTFMTVFSAWTFTGAAGVAYESGFSVLIIYMANALGFFLNFLFVGPWFRQLRATTTPEVVRMRFGPATQRLYAIIAVPKRLIYAAVHLYGLAIFCSAVFGYNIQIVIFMVGLVVIYYSASGGRWAVMATDFLQGLILVPITIIVAVLCLIKLGGFSGMFELIEAHNLTSDYSIINGPEQFAGAFTWGWMTAMFLKQVVVYNSLIAAPRFFSVKDGSAARKAALMSMFLMLGGCIFWFLPPMTARLLFSGETMAMAISKPAEASYAVASLQLLPTGLTGLIVVAILTATMSSMDTGLNVNVAIIIKDLYPSFCEAFGLKTKDEATLLKYSRLYTLGLGGIVIAIALYFSQSEGKGIFEIMLDIGALLATPMAVPLVWGIFFKRTPKWSAYAAIAGAFIPSALAFFSESLFGDEWLFQTKVFAVFTGGSVAFLLSTLFPESKDEGHRSNVQEFFRRMHTPINFKEEVGDGNDLAQLSVIGRLGLGVSIFILALLLIPNPMEGRLAILALAGSIAGVSGLMMMKGRPTNRNGDEQ